MANLIQNEKLWQVKYNKQFKKRLATYLSKTGTYLDYGCGFGCLAFFLAKDYPKMQITGLDADKLKINEGKKRYEINNLKLKVGSKIEGNFDLISLFSVAHHLKNPNKFLRDIYMHLNLNGKLVIFDYKKVPKSEFRKLYNLRIRKNKSNLEDFNIFYEHCNKFTIEQIVKLLEDCGFKTLKFELLDNFRFFYVGEKQ